MQQWETTEDRPATSEDEFRTSIDTLGGGADAVQVSPVTYETGSNAEN